MARAAEKKGRVLMVGMNHRYRPDVQLVRSFVQSGELGHVDSVRGSWHLFKPSRQQESWRQRRDTAGGGVLLDLGLGMLDLGLWLAGNPVPVRASATWDEPARQRGVEQSGAAFVVCENGASIFFDVTWHHVGPGERFGMGVRASKGTASVNPVSVWKELHGVPTDVSPTGTSSRETAFTLSYRAEWAHFVAACVGEVKAPNLADLVLVHRVMDAIYRSAEEGKDISL
jgi:predicted dehydrogenase